MNLYCQLNIIQRTTELYVLICRNNEGSSVDGFVFLYLTFDQHNLGYLRKASIISGNTEHYFIRICIMKYRYYLL